MLHASQDRLKPGRPRQAAGRDTKLRKVYWKRKKKSN